MYIAVQWFREEAIAVISIDNPPVNALNHCVRAGLLTAFSAAEQDPKVKIVLLYCEGRTFVAGADIHEFGQLPQSPILSELTLALENFNKPSLAVLHGTILGGGLEVALACDYRIIQSSAKVGLPEVKLGLLPGAGGTQRLPRLAGVVRAFDMIVGGEPISAIEAKSSGIVDELYDGKPIVAGLAYAKQLLQQGVQSRRSGQALIPQTGQCDLEYLAAKRAEIVERQPGLFSPLRCITAIEAAITLPLEEGLQRERALFLECLESPQRTALVHKFFAERQAAKIVALDHSIQSLTITCTAVIGGGSMGANIVLALARAGFSVKLLERDDEQLKAALCHLEALLEADVQHGIESKASKEQILARVEGIASYAGLSEVDLVIEAAYEDLSVKQKIFAELDQACHPRAILASTTSSLNLEHVAALMRRTQNVVGLHFFNSTHITSLLEIESSKQTDPVILASALQFGKRLVKTVVVVGMGQGSIGNRMALSYIREAELLLEEGSSVQQIDTALRDFGMAAGPFAMLDMSGLDVWLALYQQQSAQLPLSQRSPRFLEHLCATGQFGQKSGAGFYLYSEDSHILQPNQQVYSLLQEPLSARKVDLDPQNLWQRPIYALINEGALILAQGMVQRASDIDVIFMAGYGFPAHRGGPMFMAEQIGLAAVLEDIRALYKVHGERWKPAPLLEYLVTQGKSFADLDLQG